MTAWDCWVSVRLRFVAHLSTMAFSYSSVKVIRHKERKFSVEAVEKPLALINARR